MNAGTFNGWNVVTLPATQIRSVDFTAAEMVAIASSPWTGQTQTYDWQQSILSATVTLAKLTRQQGAAWIAALLSCRGPLNVFAMGDPSQSMPFGAAGTNLVPDPTFSLPLGVLWSQPDANWWISTGDGYNRANSIRMAAADGGKIVSSTSTAIPVTPGVAYTVAAYIDASQCTSGSVAVRVVNSGNTVIYANLSAAPGQAGLFTGGFSVPAGNTAVHLIFLADACVVNAGQSLGWSWPVLLGGYPAATIPAPQWNSTTAYVAGNVATFSGVNYICTAGNTNKQPPNAAYWAVDTQFPVATSRYMLNTNGWAPGVSNLLLPGDCFTLMSAPVNPGDISIPRLYRATAPAASDAQGNSTLQFWPPLRETPASGTPIQLINPQGLFRLAKPHTKWNVNYDRTASLSFDMVEAL